MTKTTTTTGYRSRFLRIASPNRSAQLIVRTNDHRTLEERVESLEFRMDRIEKSLEDIERNLKLILDHLEIKSE